MKIEELSLIDAAATIAKTPSVIKDRSLMIDVKIPSAALTDSTYGKKGLIKEVKM